MSLTKYKGKYGFKLLISEPYNKLLKLRMWFYSTFYKKIFDGNRRDIQKNGYELTFEDDFDTLDRNVWRTDNWWGARFHEGNIVHNNTAPLWYFDDNYLETKDSILKIKTDHDPIEINYTDDHGKDWGNWTIVVKSLNF